MDEIEKGAGQTIAVLLERLAAGAWHQKENFLSKTKVKFKSGFEDYLKQTFERCSKTKTIINRSEPVLIREIHVPLKFRIADRIYNERAISDKILDGQQIVITGIAGCGKSMSMKSIYLNFSQSGAVIPVFAELRHAAEFDGNLIQYLTAQIGSFVPAFTEQGLRYGLREGIIALVLDGFDEIVKDQQERLEREILEVVRESPLAKLLVSGRPNDRYSSWPSFYTASVEELDQSQVETLISRMQYDVASVDRLIKRVKSGLYETHATLLGNPLLCSMMLLTFDEFSDIPSKMYIFYRKAFEVLYRKHDTLKPQYTRQFFTALSEDDFVRIFEAFCFLSFSDEVYSFEGETIYNYANESIQYDGSKNISENDYVSDIVENVCVILKEGDHFSFLHRSFQEYFAACFVIGRGRDNITDIITGLGTNLFDSSVIEFTAEMNREALDRTYAKKIIPLIINDLKSSASDGDSFLLFYSEFSIRNNSSVIMHTYVSAEDLPKYAVHLHFIEKIYGRGQAYSGPYHLIDSAATKLGIIGGGDTGETLFGPNRDTKSKFDQVLEGAKFKEEVTKYLQIILDNVTKIEQRRDALTAKRSLARKAIGVETR